MFPNLGPKVLSIKSFLALLFSIQLLSNIIKAQNNSVVDEPSQKIDSLIKVNPLNEKAILITFGADAITAIKTEKGIVVIDAGISTGLTEKYKKIIEDIFIGTLMHI